MQILQNDIVKVNFNNSQFTLCDEARVENAPHATGESWIFYDLNKDKLHHVSEPCTVTLIRNRENTKSRLVDLPTIEQAGIIAVGIAEKNKGLNANETAMFIAGFQECIKYLSKL